MDELGSEVDALLVLEDGRVFEGVGFGAPGEEIGEVVFNTSMTGYQEILTDPSYAGQVVVLTTAHVGNYGVNARDMESGRVHAAGLVVRSLARRASNWRSEGSLEEWMEREGVVGISEVDTRALTRHIRDRGVMKAAIVRGAAREDAATIAARLEASPDYGDEDFVGKVAASGARHARPADGGGWRAEEASPGGAGAERVVVLDFGSKSSIVECLLERGLDVVVLPGSSSWDEIARWEPRGVMLSNGPGDPAQLDDRLDGVRDAIASGVPTYGICLGHQLLARALGATTFKLQFGHRGPNQPVLEVATGKVAMTSQNHGYAVAADSLPDGVEVTHVNLNDDTVAGFAHATQPVVAVQYHPEAGPGPHDAAVFFDDFAGAVRGEAREDV